MIGLPILAFALAVIAVGILMDAKTVTGAIAKNVLVIGGIVVILAFTTAIVSP